MVYCSLHLGFDSQSQRQNILPMRQVRRPWECRCDTEGGCHKTFADKTFDRFVMLPEDDRISCSWASNHKVEDGVLLSLAETVYNILQDEDYIHGARSHSARKSKKAKKLIEERCFVLRERGDAGLMGVKMSGSGFEKGKRMGLQAHHCFVADPAVHGFKVMACRMPCLCGPCKERFTKPVKDCYRNPHDDCTYWTIFEG